MDSSASPAVETAGLAKRFGSFTAVEGLSFSVPRGEVFGFLGPNGAGKSTTIKMLCGILAPSAGHGTVAGFDILREAEQVRTRIGYMSQKFSLYEDLTVAENIEFYAGVYGVGGGRLRERRRWVLEMAGLREKEAAVAGGLSAGWKQRLALGCAFVHEPEILFLDEPTSGVDPVSRRSFWDLIYEVSRRGVTVFVTTHYMDEAEHCDRLGMIFGGRLAALGTPSELRDNAVKGVLLEVKAEPLMASLEALERSPTVLEAAVYGSSLHVLVASRNDTEALSDVLRGAGVALRSVKSIRPSLEDAFVALLTRAEGREAGSAPEG